MSSSFTGIAGIFGFLYLAMPGVIKFSNLVNGAPTLGRMGAAHWPPAVAECYLAPLTR